MLTYLSKILFNIQKLPLFEDKSIALIDKDDGFFELLKENKDDDLNIEIINSKLEELKKDFLSLEMSASRTYCSSLPSASSYVNIFVMFR